MRTFLNSFAAVVLALSFLTSCGTDAKDIKVADLETACDYADAMTSVASAIVELQAEVKEGEEPTPEQEKEKKDLDAKMNEITQAAINKEVSFEEVKACEGYKVD
jgi:hypothetical protein